MTHDVSANTGRLPANWAHDPLASADVYRRIRALGQGKDSFNEIARQIGCSSRTVRRVMRHRPADSPVCGARRLPPYTGHCTNRVPGGGPCRFHR